MVEFSPRKIRGCWKAGYALDWHIRSSEFIGYNEFGYEQYKTVRSPVGELLFQLKYRDKLNVVDELVAAAKSFVREWDPAVEVIIPVPPSNADRQVQPVRLVGERLSSQLGLEWAPVSVVKTKSTPQLKDVTDFEEKKELLDGAFEVKTGGLEGKAVLLFDDLFQSGATMNAVADVLKQESHVDAIFALALTRTSSAR
ncbi:MAG: hypothetical protein OXB98_18750 [Bryobacterales bacterium]|nr:hypothetical protein [Bryobacterales bacterium]